MLDRPMQQERKRARKGACERKRRERARRKAGLARYGLDLPEHDLVEAMPRSSRVTECEALDHARIEAALRDIALDWIARWLK
jgi:hypothetical protein